MASSQWHRVCELKDLEVNWGEATLIEGHQYALFRTEDNQVFASDHRDPNSGALVIARGIVGQQDGDFTLTSPLYKDVFSLTDGHCLSGADFTLPVYPTRVQDGQVFIGTPLS